MNPMTQVHHTVKTRFASGAAKKTRLDELRALRDFYRKRKDADSVRMYEEEIRRLED